MADNNNSELAIKLEIGGEELRRQFPAGTQLGDAVQALTNMTRSVRGKLVIHVNGVEETSMNRPLCDGDRITGQASTHELG